VILIQGHEGTIIDRAPYACALSLSPHLSFSDILARALSLSLSLFPHPPSLPPPSPTCLTLAVFCALALLLAALVPGCRRGYDVIEMAKYGFNSVGLDIAPTAVESAHNEMCLKAAGVSFCLLFFFVVFIPAGLCGAFNYKDASGT